MSAQVTLEDVPPVILVPPPNQRPNPPAGATVVSVSPSSAQVGTRLQATLTDPDGGVSDTQWQWERRAEGSSSWTGLGSRGASSAFLPVGADAGQYLRATVTYIDGESSGPTDRKPAASAALGPVRARPVRTVSYSASSYVAREDGDTATVRVTLSPAPTGAVAVKVKVTVAPGANTEAGDFATVDLASDSTLSFTSSAASDSFKIVARSDADSEDETVLLGFKDLPPGIDPGTHATATVTLLDATLKVVGPASVSVGERVGEVEGGESVATYRATDPWDGPLWPVTWSLSGDDATRFQMNGNTLEFSSGPDYEQSLDEGGANVGNNVYVVNLRASYARTYHSAPFPVTVSVTNVEEPGVVSVLPSGQPRVGRELKASLTDPDGSVADTVWQWQHRAEGSSSWTSLGSRGAGSAFMPIAADAGQYLRARVTYIDGESSGPTDRKPAASVALGPIASRSNRRPNPPAGPTAVSFAEESADTVATYRLTDPDPGDVLTLKIGGPSASTDSSAFRIRGDTLYFKKMADFPDFEAPTDIGGDDGDNDYVVRLYTWDGSLSSDTVAVTVSVTNVDEPGAVSLTSTSPRVGTRLTVVLTDPDGDVAVRAWHWQRRASATAEWEPPLPSSSARAPSTYPDRGGKWHGKS